MGTIIWERGCEDYGYGYYRQDEVKVERTYFGKVVFIHRKNCRHEFYGDSSETYEITISDHSNEDEIQGNILRVNNYLREEFYPSQEWEISYEDIFSKEI